MNIRVYFILLFVFLFFPLFGKENVSRSDSTSIVSLWETFFLNRTGEIEEKMIKLGESFIGTSYVSGRLGSGENEKLIVDLKQLDCVTFIDYVLGISLVRDPHNIYQEFVKRLRELRYLNDSVRYGERLHYSTSFIMKLERLGIARDITRELGGVILEKEINFMSTNRHLYPGFKDDEEFECILMQEESVNERLSYWLPKGEIKEELLKNGDLVFFSTTIKGLDFAHVGFVVKKNSMARLLHASSDEKQVILSTKSLKDYALGIRKFEGIVVLRLSH